MANFPARRFTTASRVKETVWKLANPLASNIADFIIRTRRRRSVAIFAAHGVHTPAMCDGVKPPPSSKRIEQFEKALSAIKRHFTIISMEEAVEMLSGSNPVRAACAAITFDDSLKCMADLAGPLLASMNLTATFFVSTEAIQTQEPYWWLRLDYAILHTRIKRLQINLLSGDQFWLDTSSAASGRCLKRSLRSVAKPERDRVLSQLERLASVSLTDAHKQYPFAAPLTWEGVSELLRLGMSIGSHTVSHANLLAISESELCSELRDSKRLINEKSGAECRYFCYPFGLHSDALSRFVSTCGYDAAVTTVGPGWNGPGDNLFTLKRFYLPRDWSRVQYLLCTLR